MNSLTNYVKMKKSLVNIDFSSIEQKGEKMKNAMQRLNEIVKERGPLLAGLDPNFDKIINMWKVSNDGTINPKDTDTIEDKDVSIMIDFCLDYIRSLKKEVGAIKINSAFFESRGMEDVYWVIAEYARQQGLFVIGDLKRADIGNTSREYAEAYLNVTSPFDAITINPYFGTDGVKPFLDLAKESGKGVFVLVKTSNTSSCEIQDLDLLDGRKVYEAVADMVKKWGEYTKQNDEEDYNLVGAVVGATHPKQAEELRKRMPNTFFLVPGYGAQGATAKDVSVNFDNTEGGAIVNSSRGIMMAYQNDRWKDKYNSKTWKEAAIAEARRAQQELKEALKAKR